MLQGIRASTLTMPSFGHSLSLSAGVQKMEGYSDVNPWNWSPQQSNPPSQQTYPHIFDPSLYTNFSPQVPVPGSVQPRHHSISTSHVVTPATSTPPPTRQQIAGHLVKAQPAFKPTWHGFLDSTKDAMTIVEAALQGRLSHISRRPHDKERAEMLTSGTVLVYEENASGIKRWTDAVHWSPSRVMNNCLIYRQLVRALKPEEKRAALNPSCGGKRKRKESADPSVSKTGENVNNSDDEYDNPNFDGSLTGDVTPTTDPLGKVYANFAQSLNPDQQRRYCGSLVDSYEFKEGGLMKKTISVKYQGTHHHIISYYSLEDVVSGKLKRPYQDPKLADIHPRPELLAGWKVSLEDEEGKDLPLIAGYSQQLQPGHIQHQGVGTTQGVPSHGIVQAHAPLHLQVPTEYWHGGQVHQYTTTQPTHQHYAPPQHTTSQYTPQQTAQSYPPQQPSPQHYNSQLPSPQPYASQQHSPQHYSSHQPSPPNYPSQPSSQQYTSEQPSTQQYPSQPARNHPYTAQPQSIQHYTSEQHVTPTQPYPQHHTTPQYPATHHNQIAQQPHYVLPQAHLFDFHVPVPQPSTPVEHEAQSPVQQHDTQRRASAPVTMQTYGQPNQHTTPQPQTYYMADQKYPPAPSYGF